MNLFWNLLRSRLATDLISSSHFAYLLHSNITTLKILSQLSRDQVYSIMTLLNYAAMQKRRQRVLNRRVFFSKVCVETVHIIMFSNICFLIYFNMFWSLQGSNWVWSIDGYDKLQLFGIYIHGAMDTFSRRIMWLNVYTSNKDPHVIAHFYYNCIKRENSKCPEYCFSQQFNSDCSLTM